MADSLRSYADQLEKLGKLMLDTADIEVAAEAAQLAAGIPRALRFDLLVQRPIRALRRSQ